MFTAVLFIITNKWKQPKYLSTDELLKKIKYIYTMDYYLAIYRNELLIHVTTWMNFQKIMLNERHQTKEDK